MAMNFVTTRSEPKPRELKGVGMITEKNINRLAAVVIEGRWRDKYDNMGWGWATDEEDDAPIKAECEEQENLIKRIVEKHGDLVGLIVYLKSLIYRINEELKLFRAAQNSKMLSSEEVDKMIPRAG
jgi:hypothetical protein